MDGISSAGALSGGSPVAAPLQGATGGPPGSAPPRRIEGKLGTLDIVLATLAYTAPLAAVAGYLTFIIGYGNGLGAASAFIPVTLALLMFALGYGAMTKFVSNPGAFYAYITAGLGRIPGLGSAFLIVFSYLSVGVGFYGFAGLITSQFIVGHGGPEVPWWALSLVFWIVVASLSFFHIQVSAKVLGVLLIAEIIVVLIFDAVLLTTGGPEGTFTGVLSWDNFTSGQLGIAMVFGAGIYAGFEATAIYREEARNPEKTIPRATIIVVLSVGAIYFISSWALITGLGPSQAVELSAADPAGAFMTVASEYVGRAFYDIASTLLITSTLASHLAIQNVTTRYVYSLSIDGILPKYFGVAHARHRSPARASVVTSCTYLVLTTIVILIGLTPEQMYAWLGALSSLATLLAISMTSLSAFVFFRRNRDHPVSWFRGTLAPLLGFLALISIALYGASNLSFLTGGSQALSNGLMIAIVCAFATGCIVAAVLRRRAPHVYAAIGRQDMAQAAKAPAETAS